MVKYGIILKITYVFYIYEYKFLKIYKFNHNLISLIKFTNNILENKRIIGYKLKGGLIYA